MSGDGKDGVSNAQIMHGLGKLTGMVETMHQSMTIRIEDIRSEIRRIDRSHSEGMRRLESAISESEKRTNKRIDEVCDRVMVLESADKKLSEKVAYLAAGGGGIGGILAAGIVELIKHYK